MTGGPVRVLVVDDDIDLLLLYRVSLETNGHEVTQAATGWEAVAAARADDYELMLLDMMLPGLDGFGVLAELAGDAHTRELPVVVVSARTAVDDQIRTLHAGAVAYLTKPFAIESLLDLVTEIGTRHGDLGDLRASALARLNGAA